MSPLNGTRPEAHILNYGMGVESTAILLSWIVDPPLRPAPLDRVTVITAQTGNEYASTARMVTRHILPLLREHRMRFVQVARHGPRERDGYTILDDSRCPQELFSDGDYALGQELLENGTIPAYSAPHHCAIKSKGFPIDSFIREHFSEHSVTQYFGYNADEPRRAEKCEDYRTKRSVSYRFPLLEMGWSRDACQQYIISRLGEPFPKSACYFCPWVQRQLVESRFTLEPEEAAHTLFLEWVALAFNPRMHLFPYGSAREVCTSTRNTHAIALLQAKLNASEWGMYRVERIWMRKVSSQTGKHFTRVDRRIRCIRRGTRSSMEGAVIALFDEGRGTLDTSGEHVRLLTETRDLSKEESCEGFYVAAPAVVRDKVRNEASFQEAWERINGIVVQLRIL